MNCLVIDDNAKTSEMLSALLKASDAFVNIHHAVQPYMIRSLMAWEKIDMIFIRVRLWDYSVFEKIADKMPMIVFLSGGKERITEKEQTTVEYQLREPYTEESVKRLMRQMVFKPDNERPNFFFVRFEGRYHKILFSEIELVERMLGSYIRLHTKQTPYLLPGSLAGMMDRLPEDRFIRVSDGLIVPAAEMPKINGDEYEFKGKKHRLTFRFAASARREMESWPHGL